MYLIVGLAAAFLFVWLLGPRYGIDAPALVRTILGNEGEAPAIAASGVVRADTLQVSTALGGRVQAVHVAAGDEVRAGQVVVELDTTLLDAQVAAAQAAVDLARAVLAQVQAGARPGAIQAAEAQLEQAQTAHEVALAAQADAEAYLNDPQLLEMEAAVAYAQVAGAQHRVNQATAIKDAAEFAQGRFYEAREALPFNVEVRSGNLQELIPEELAGAIPEEIWNAGDGTYHYQNLTIRLQNGQYTVSARVEDLPFDAHLMPNNYWQSWIGVNSAQASLEGIQSYAWRATQHANDPLEVRAQVEAAQAAVARTSAQVEIAQAYVDGLEAGATREQIAAVQAQVDRAEAALSRLLLQRDQAVIVSPCDCIVTETILHPGELAAPNAALLTLADMRAMRMVAYVQETDLGSFVVGAPVTVTVDAWPNRTFSGSVSRIGERAEFTPRNVSTRDERVNLVFAVDIALQGDVAGIIKPGMVGEVTLTP